MALYVLDDRSITGHSGIDAAHARIAELSNELAAAVGRGAGQDRVYDVFRRLRRLLLSHFELEERCLADLPDTEEVRDHVRRHKADHELFRNMFTYADDQFRAKRDTEAIPDITQMIPEKYFEELKTLDTEMAALFQSFGISEDCKSKECEADSA